MMSLVLAEQNWNLHSVFGKDDSNRTRSTQNVHEVATPKSFAARNIMM